MAMKIKVTISGLTPLLMNRFTSENEVAVSGGTRVSIQGEKGTPREQAVKKAYIDKNGALYVPGANIFASLIAAGTFQKAGKSKLTTQKTSLVPAGIGLDDIICSLTTADGEALTEWEVDSRSVVIPSTGGRIMCHRPRVDQWRLSFSLDLDTTMFTPKLARLLVDDAGKKIGLGDYRPQRKGPFGRFVVVNWQELTELKAVA
jgi:hypothetical protein